MKKITNFVLCMSLLLPLKGQNLEDSIDSLFTQWVDNTQNQPGITIAIIDGSNTVYKKAFGMANLEYKINLTSNSIFDIASLAKQFTGFAIATLEAENRLKLEDPLIKYFPGLEKIAEGITINHLIHHSSGLRDIGELFDIGHFGFNLTSAKTIEIMKLQKELNFKPGSESDYSNTNYVLLARIVEIITNQSFRAWCQEHIFTPLKMNNSFANDNPEEIISNRATAYYQNKDWFSFNQNNGMFLIGSSAVYSSTNDLIKWSNALLNNTNFKSIFEKMQTKGSLNDETAIDYGYGLALGSYKGKKMVFHTGSTPSGFRTSIALFPDEGKAVILLSNLGNIDLNKQFQFPVLDIIFQHEDITEPVKEEESLSLELIDLNGQQLDMFVGDYLFNKERLVKIRKGQNGLTVQPDGVPEMELIPLNENKLYFPGFKSILIFTKEEGGEKFNEAKITSEGNHAGAISRVTMLTEGTFIPELYLGNYYCSELNLYWEIRLKQKMLSIYDTKSGTFEIVPISKYTFKDKNILSINIDFLTDSNDEITGFNIHRGRRLRNLLFRKLN